jgi:hypothetical protein
MLNTLDAYFSSITRGGDAIHALFEALLMKIKKEASENASF